MHSIHRRFAGVAVLAAVACTRKADVAVDTAAPTVIASTPKPADSSDVLAVTERGLGPLQIGMTLAEASAALKGDLVAPGGADTSACAYAQWRGGPPGVRVMIEAGRIARIDVVSGSVATRAGARIGDAEQRVDSLYAGHVTTTPHKYTKGHYLTVAPSAPVDSAYRIVFETEGQRVTVFRTGRRPAVEYVEGCS